MRTLSPLKRVALIALPPLLLGAGLVTAAEAATPPAFRLQTVTVLDAKTVEATFSNPLAAKNTDLATRVFHARHYDWDVPHSHEATSVALTNGGRTARVTLDRALHSDNPPCDGSEPRCSDDELPFVITKATDTYGQTLSNDDWEVWAVGSELDDDSDHEHDH
ncbi:hypothetical protein [Streptomyces tailanensis]|uniref:hypothetical protein n=1 Tax=Streptomyces tailanensis TaxID=2569858 RepID=UPI00122E76AB|nr:hypothetical protein [Streptomyces tailanensis]